MLFQWQFDFQVMQFVMDKGPVRKLVEHMLAIDEGE
jgi:hypothetical protein